MLTALHIATDTVGNVVLQQSLVRVAPIVKEGGRVVQAIQATGIFEPLAINLVRVGEETGRVGPMMLELASILNREVERYQTPFDPGGAGADFAPKGADRSHHCFHLDGDTFCQRLYV